MHSPYGLEIVDCCSSCRLRSSGFFCNFSSAALQYFDHIKSASAFPRGAVLFVQGQPTRGIFVVCQGRVKQSISSIKGKKLILKIAEPGEVLGLGDTISGKRYGLTAETMDPCQVVFVKRDEFLRFLHEYGDACLGAAEQLGRNCNAVCHGLRSLGRSHSATEKLALYLLELIGKSAEPVNKQPQLHKLPSHKEISQTIGTSRETVTRLLADLRRENIVQTEGTTLVVPSRAALERLLVAPSQRSLL